MRSLAWALIQYDFVQSLSRVQLFVTPGTAACQAYLSFTISQNLLKLTSIESVMASNQLILCRPFLLLSSIFPSITVFPNEVALCIRWPQYWSFSINPSSEYSGLISFRIDWEDIVVHKLCPYVYKTTTTNADKATRAERWSRIDYILQLRHLQWQLSPTHIRERFTCYFCSAKKNLNRSSVLDGNERTGPPPHARVNYFEAVLRDVIWKLMSWLMELENDNTIKHVCAC